MAVFSRIGGHHGLSECVVLFIKTPDVLVSNAGICPFWDFLTMPREVWDHTRQVNLDGSFYIVQGN